MKNTLIFLGVIFAIIVIVSLLGWELYFAIVIVILALPVVVIGFHHWALLWPPYRWLINSIIYPIAKMRILHKYKLMSYSQRLRSYTDYELSAHWAKGYWFSKRLRKAIVNKFFSDLN